MRGVVLLLILVGGIYIGANFFGAEEEPTKASAGADVSAADGDGAGEATPPPADREPPATHGGAPAVDAPPAPPGEVSALISRVEKGEELGPDLAVPPGAAELGDWIRAAAGDDPGPRWIGLSRLYAAEGARHPGLRERALEAARKGATSAALSEEYVVVGGDSLYRICQRMKKDRGILVTPGMLQWANGVQGDRIVPGQRLRVPRGPLRITVDKSDFVLRLWLGEGLVREYPVGIGREDRTPEADFVIDSRLVKPPWPHPETGKVLHFGEPGYQIGTRWLGFDDDSEHKGFGIHGTDEPDSIGKARSLGCIRLRNDQVEELFELVPEGIAVSIRG